MTILHRPVVFLSYCHIDRRWLDRVLVHLKPLEDDSQLEIWSDRRIDAGDKWRLEIADAVSKAKVAILIVSADFIASKFIRTEELPPLLKAAEEKGTIMMPLIASASRFEHTPSLAQFQAVNSPSRPLNGLPKAKQEEILLKLSLDVEIALKNQPVVPTEAIAAQPKIQYTPIRLEDLNIPLDGRIIYRPSPPEELCWHNIRFRISGARISLSSVFEGDFKEVRFRDPYVGVRALHLIINAGDGRKSYGRKLIGYIQCWFDSSDSISIPVILGANIREWAIGNKVVSTVQGRLYEDSLIDSVEDTNSNEVFSGHTFAPEGEGAVAVMDKLTIPIPATYWKHGLMTIRFTRELRRDEGPLDYFVSAITIEHEQE
jgi:TIR domain